jgi:hypothetical protein
VRVDAESSGWSLRGFLEGIDEQLTGTEGTDAIPAVAFHAARELAFDEDALRAATRRAMLVLAAGGDPHREMRLGDVAVVRLADELDSVSRRDELARQLRHVAHTAVGLPAIERAVAALQADSDLAWRWVALALVVSERFSVDEAEDSA